MGNAAVKKYKNNIGQLFESAPAGKGRIFRDGLILFISIHIGLKADYTHYLRMDVSFNEQSDYYNRNKFYTRWFFI